MQYIGMPIPTRAEPQRPGLLREGVYLRLRDAIVDGTLAPGETVRDQELAAWLGVSRTPVREALLKLSDAGLVYAAPGRSTTVAALEVAAIRDAQAVVGAMHRLAVLSAVTRLTSEQLDTMREANRRFQAAIERGDVEAAVRADDQFHAVPVQVAANAALASVLEQYTPIIRRLERLRFASHAARGSIDLHTKLIETLAQADAATAAQVSDQTWQGLESLIATLAPS